MSDKIDLVGKRFFRWKVIAFRPMGGRSYWKCRCKCGVEKIVYGLSLKRGLSKSCGCWRIENGVIQGHRTKGGRGNGGTSRTHGEAIARTPEYCCWLAMRNRCSNPSNQKWDDYGGRGIKVCKRWEVYENFLADMGRRPSDVHSIDRKNNDGNYTKRNCRWANKKQQVDNRRPYGSCQQIGA